jgi:hypothetical protein
MTEMQPNDQVLTTVWMSYHLREKLRAYKEATGVPMSDAMRKGALIYYALKYNNITIEEVDDED